MSNLYLRLVGCEEQIIEKNSDIHVVNLAVSKWTRIYLAQVNHIRIVYSP